MSFLSSPSFLFPSRSISVSRPIPIYFRFSPRPSLFSFLLFPSLPHLSPFFFSSFSLTLSCFIPLSSHFLADFIFSSLFPSHSLIFFSFSFSHYFPSHAFFFYFFSQIFLFILSYSFSLSKLFSSPSFVFLLILSLFLVSFSFSFSFSQSF